MPGITYTPPAVTGGFMPVDHGYLAWSFDPGSNGTGTIIPTGGLLHLVKLKLDQGALVSNVVIHLTSAGATLTAGQNFAGLYSAAGALLSVTADQAAAWQTGGLKTMALAVAQTVGAGYVYAAFWAVGSTLPTLSRGNVGGAAVGNAGLAAPNLRFATADAGLTTTAPPTFGAQTGSGTGWWVALS